MTDMVARFEPSVQQIFRQIFEILAFERTLRGDEAEVLETVAQEIYHLSEQYGVDADAVLDELHFLGVER